MKKKVFLLGISILVALSAGVFAPADSFAKDQAQAAVRNVFLLGIDGMDPNLLERFVADGRMPTFKKLMEDGSYSRFGTSIPPQSPVAWSNFITGQDPGGHGIFDFIHRDPKNYLPFFSASSVEEPKRVLKLGSWRIPLSKGKVLLLREGEAFWQILSKNGVPCTIFRIPSNFPPVKDKARQISGMGTPDLLGTYGTFSFFTDDPSMATLDVSGGKIYPVNVEDDNVQAEITGPQNTMKKGEPNLKVPFSVYIDRENHMAKIDIEKEELLLKVGEMSPWVELSFKILGPFHSVKGICRFFLKSIDPYFMLYVTPINIDPAHPALPISTPGNYIKELYKKIGFHYTQGMPEDTKGLEWGALSDGEFLKQVKIVLDERTKMLDVCLNDYKGGFMFFYISTLDQCCHMLWRNMDPKHPMHTKEAAKYQDAIENLYADMDSILNVVMKRLPENTTLLIMSDHGFAPFYKKFNLNTWLYQNGYIEVMHPNELLDHSILGDVYWRRTRAYALGINGLYINLRGREGKGIVNPGEDYDSLITEISEKLLKVRDPETGEQVISKVYRTSEVYHGDQAKNAPDMIVGYHVGYRSSDQSALGNFTKDLLELNMSKWSGDHCMATNEVPGIFLSDRKLIMDNPSLVDLTATILNLYGIEKTPQMVGKPMLAE